LKAKLTRRVKCRKRHADLPRMRDIEIIDSELWLLLAIRQMVYLIEGRPPGTAHIDALLEEPTTTEQGA
jgi:hypothetical protein